MSSIFPGQNVTNEQRNSQRTKNDKVVDDTSNEETMKSTCRQVKKEDKQIPHSYIMLIVLRIEIALHKKNVKNHQVG